MKPLLNAKIKRRESFRPLAPSVLEEAERARCLQAAGSPGLFPEDENGFFGNRQRNDF
jgi:predicted NodU family carbamoyl transferase